MTTPISPDGQTPPTTTTPEPSTRVGEPVRDWAEVQKIIDQRDEEKQARIALEQRLAALEGKVAAPPPPAPPSDPLAAVKAEIEAIKAQGLEAAKAQCRAAIEAAVLAHAGEKDRETVRLMLSGLGSTGAVDLTSEDVGGTTARALEKLRANSPGMFTVPGSSAPADSIRHGVVPEGTPLHEYTREQLDLVSDEDFSKIRRQGAKSKLAV